MPVLCSYEAVTVTGEAARGSVVIFCYRSSDIREEFEFRMQTARQCWVPWHGPRLARWILRSYLPKCELPVF